MAGGTPALPGIDLFRFPRRFYSITLRRASELTQGLALGIENIQLHFSAPESEAACALGGRAGTVFLPNAINPRPGSSAHVAGRSRRGGGPAQGEVNRRLL